MSKHTKGPWTAKAIGIPTDNFDDNSKRIVRSAWTIVGPEDWICRDVNLSEANAHLIAAAPDMLDALELMQSNNRLMNALNTAKDRHILDAILNAIAKARGEA